jgi:hypothetical protein
MTHTLIDLLDRSDRIYSLFVGNNSSDKDVYDDDNILYSEWR